MSIDWICCIGAILVGFLCGFGFNGECRIHVQLRLEEVWAFQSVLNGVICLVHARLTVLQRLNMASL